MRPLSRYLLPGLVAAFAVVSAYELRGDIAQISLSPVHHSFELVWAAVLCSLLNYCLRIVRWRHYLARLGHGVPLGFASLTYVAGFAFTLSPGKVGEMTRGRYYSRFNISLSDVGAAFCMERLLDVVAMLALATLVLAVAPRYQNLIWGAGVMIVVVLALLALLPWKSIAASLTAASSSVSYWRRTPARLGAGLARALGATRSLLRARELLFGFATGCLAWALEGLGLFLLICLLPAAHITPVVSIGIYAVAVLAGAISFVPGGLGSTEAVMTALLASQGLTVPDALLVTMLCRIVTLWLAVCLGWVAIFALRHDLAPAV
jgi:uncharacterized protein (TIRG00374 family)